MTEFNIPLPFSIFNSVMYIFCNEEPLWMNKCFSAGGLLEFKGSWKSTALSRSALKGNSSFVVNEIAVYGYSLAEDHASCWEHL
jgi:hypothetical protein